MKPALVMSDPEAMCRSALTGLGVTLIAMPHVLTHLERGTLVRVVPDWHVDAGPTSLYFASKTLLPAKTRAFVDFIVEAFQRQDLARRFSAK
jgi:DNA-binding transcriptional LysR family regulator